VFGSYGYSNGFSEYAGNEHGSWTFFDSIPGSTMQATSYTACVTVTWIDMETYQQHSDFSCGSGWVEPVQPTISGPNTLWWFNGENPSGYSTSIDLSSDAGRSTQWSIVDGSDKVTLSTTQGEYTTLTSIGYSQSGGDVRIAATVEWGTTEFTVTVRAPHSLVPVRASYECDATYGYFAQLLYVMQDQLGTDLPSDVPINEQWTTGVSNDYAGANWRRADPQGLITDGPAFVDGIFGEYPGLPAVPQPTCDGNSQPVQHWGQTWQVGSLTIGAGRRVQTNTLQKLIGRALHTNIISPSQ
jgi:hypothetical protein